MTYDPSDKEHGIIYHGWAGDSSPIGKMTRHLEKAWKDGEKARWGSATTARWYALCDGMAAITFYTNDEIEVQIVNRLADGKDRVAPPKPAAAPKRKLRRKG